MKNTLLIAASVAALMAGMGMVSAQGLNERRDAPAATTSEPKAPQGDSGHEKSALPQKNEKMTKPAPTAQAPEVVKPAPTAQTQEKAKPAPTAQAPEKTDSDRQKVGQSPAQGGSPNGPSEKGSKTVAAAPMSSEQNVKFRETLKGEKTERLNNVKFSISIGEEVPTSVRFHRLPARIVEYAPQYRDFDYILVGDDILIVDPATHRIVAVIAA
jgi:Protein of unknown function (DUF1236)